MNSEQLQIDSFLAPEEKFFQDIRQDLAAVIDQNYAPLEYLSFDHRKAYYAISYRDSVVVRYRLSRTRAASYIEFPVGIIKACDRACREPKLNGGMARFKVLDESSIVRDFGELVCKSLDLVINQYPKSFDCCSRFEACSDAKKCVHPDRHFAADCGYRRILKDGRVFCGKNRNV